MGSRVTLLTGVPIRSACPPNAPGTELAYGQQATDSRRGPCQPTSGACRTMLDSSVPAASGLGRNRWRKQAMTQAPAPSTIRRAQATGAEGRESRSLDVVRSYDGGGNRFLSAPCSTAAPAAAVIMVVPHSPASSAAMPSRSRSGA